MKKTAESKATRNFRGKYEIIVVGAGIAGLSAAALMQNRGHKVLLLEQAEEPGGVCRALRTEGYTFDLGCRVFFGLGYQSQFNFLQNVIDELHLGLDFKLLDPGMQIVMPDQTFKLGAEQRSFFRQVSSAFPGEARGLKKLYHELGELHETLSSLPRHHAMGRWTIIKLCLTHPWFARKLLSNAPRSLFDLYRKDLNERRCFNILESMVASLTMLDAEEIPAFLASLILLSPFRGGIWYPMGGSGALTDALLKSFTNAGGQFESGCKVNEILVGGGRARGVRLENGTLIHSERVISDVPKEHLFGRLVDAIHISDGVRKQVAYQENADSLFGVYLGVDANVVPEGTPVHSVVVPRYFDNWREARPVIVSIPTLVDPSLAPAGKHVVIVMSPEKAYGWERNSYYAEKKRQLAREKIAIAERVLPGLEKSIQFIETSSPLTWEKYTLRPKGTFGIKMDIRQGLLNRQGNKTEVANLYCVGDSTFPGSGVFAVSYSARMCADLICLETGRGLPPVEKV